MRINVNKTKASAKMIGNMAELVWADRKDVPSCGAVGSRLFNELSKEGGNPITWVWDQLASEEIKFRPGDCICVSGIAFLRKPEVPDGEIWMAMRADRLKYSAPYDIVVENVG